MGKELAFSGKRLELASLDARRLTLDAFLKSNEPAVAWKYLRNSSKVSGYGTKSASKTETNSALGSQTVSASLSAPPLKPALEVRCKCFKVTPGLTSASVNVHPSPSVVRSFGVLGGWSFPR